MIRKDIHLKLSSSADFSAINKATSTLQNNLGGFEKGVRGAISGLSGSFKNLGNELMRGGIWGLASNLAVKALSAAWEWFEKTAARSARMVQSVWTDTLSRIRSDIEDLDKTFTKTMSRLDKSAAAASQKLSSLVKMEHSRIELLKQQNIASGMDKDEASRKAAAAVAEVDFAAEEKSIQDQKRVEQRRLAELRQSIKDREKALKEARIMARKAGRRLLQEMQEEDDADFLESEKGKELVKNRDEANKLVATLEDFSKIYDAEEKAQNKLNELRRQAQDLDIRKASYSLSLENDDKERAAKAAEEEAKRKLEEEKAFQAEQARIAQEYAKEQARIDKERYDAMERMERDLAQKRLAELKDELSYRKQLQSDASSRSSAADSSLARAWEMYRDKSKMQAAIDEHKAQIEAEKQWQKDFSNLKSWHSDWRTAAFGSLSASDEAVRQVALAKEEKAAADKAVIETAENTRELSDKLDELLQAKGG